MYGPEPRICLAPMIDSHRQIEGERVGVGWEWDWFAYEMSHCLIITGQQWILEIREMVPRLSRYWFSWAAEHELVH
jgi:hypothetical protein